MPRPWEFVSGWAFCVNQNQVFGWGLELLQIRNLTKEYVRSFGFGFILFRLDLICIRLVIFPIMLGISMGPGQQVESLIHLPVSHTDHTHRKREHVCLYRIEQA